jgi:cation diffusion facilitator family transporter
MNHHNHQKVSVEKHKAAKKSTLVSVLLNIFLSFLQMIVGFSSNSQALIADGIHSLSDLISDFVVLIANQKGKKSADEDHHYGHYRYENGASLLIGILLFLVGVGMLFGAGKKILLAQEGFPVKEAALWVAILALLSKEILFRYMLSVAKSVKSSMLIANAWHARSDAASSLVVVLGIIGSLLGYSIFDPIAALIVGLMIVRMGWNFSVEAIHDLMDRSISAQDNQKIIEIVKSTSGVIGCHDLRTRKTGDLILIDIHLEVDGKITVFEGHEIAEEVERRLFSQLPVLNVMTHIDPR